MSKVEKLMTEEFDYNIQYMIKQPKYYIYYVYLNGSYHCKPHFNEC